jgi:hypothetical protein
MEEKRPCALHCQYKAKQILRKSPVPREKPHSVFNRTLKRFDRLMSNLCFGLRNFTIANDRRDRRVEVSQSDDSKNDCGSCWLVHFLSRALRNDSALAAMLLDQLALVQSR